MEGSSCARTYLGHQRSVNILFPDDLAESKERFFLTHRTGHGSRRQSQQQASHAIPALVLLPLHRQTTLKTRPVIERENLTLDIFLDQKLSQSWEPFVLHLQFLLFCFITPPTSPLPTHNSLKSQLHCKYPHLPSLNTQLFKVTITL